MSTRKEVIVPKYIRHSYNASLCLVLNKPDTILADGSARQADAMQRMWYPLEQGTKGNRGDSTCPETQRTDVFRAAQRKISKAKDL